MRRTTRTSRTRTGTSYATIPTATLNAVLDTEVGVPNPFVSAAERARGLNLYASDTHWPHHGNGPVVIGKVAHLASVLAGRPWRILTQNARSTSRRMGVHPGERIVGRPVRVVIQPEGLPI